MGIINPHGVIPENLFRKEARAQVMAWIQREPYGQNTKVGLLRGWAACVGLTLTAEEYTLARASGWPSKPVDVPKE